MDIDYEDTLRATIIWFKNNVYNNTFNVSKITINSTTTYTDKLVAPLTKGDNWTCSAEITDSENKSGYLNSSVLLILNTAPNISISPAIIPNPAGTNDSLNCSFAFADIDTGDTITVSGIWFRNNAYNSTFNFSKTVSNGTLSYANKVVINLNANDNWTCSVQASDSENTSTWYNSTIILIADRMPPRFNPLPENQTLEFGNNFAYDVNATDNVALDSYKINDTAKFSINNNG